MIPSRVGDRAQPLHAREHARRSRSGPSPSPSRRSPSRESSGGRSPGRYLPVSTPCASGDQTTCADPVRGAEREDLAPPGCAPEQRVLRLRRDELDDAVGTRSSAAWICAGRPLREADVARLAGVDDLGQRPHRLLERRRACRSGGTGRGRRSRCAAARATRRAACAPARARARGRSSRHRDVELRREHVRVARPRRERLAEELLRGAVRVHVRRVDEVDRRRRTPRRRTRPPGRARRRRRRSATSRGRSPRRCRSLDPELPVPHPARLLRSRHRCRRSAAVQWPRGESSGRSVRVHRVRHDLRPVARALPGLRGVRDHGRGSRTGARRQACPGTAAASPRRRRRRGVGADLDRRRRARPRARRRARAGVARARRRRARRRQVDAAADRARRRLADAARAARHGRGVGRAGEAPRGAARRLRAGRDPRRDRARRRLRDARARAARRLRDRLGADALRGRARLDARLGRAGARGREPAPARRRRRPAWRRSSSAT